MLGLIIVAVASKEHTLLSLMASTTCCALLVRNLTFENCRCTKIPHGPQERTQQDVHVR